MPLPDFDPVHGKQYSEDRESSYLEGFAAGLAGRRSMRETDGCYDTARDGVRARAYNCGLVDGLDERSNHAS